MKYNDIDILANRWYSIKDTMVACGIKSRDTIYRKIASNDLKMMYKHGHPRISGLSIINWNA